MGAPRSRGVQKTSPRQTDYSINVGGALQDATLAEQTREWLAFDDKMWLDESDDAVAQGIAGDEMVARLALVPAVRSSNVKCRLVVCGIVGALVILSGAATWFGIYARKERAIAIAKAREAQARELAAYATGSLSDDPEKSILLGMQAVIATLRFGQPPVPGAERAPLQAISSSHVRSGVFTRPAIGAGKRRKCFVFQV